MSYCRKCGTQLTNDALYCYKCGTATTIQTTSAPITTQQPPIQPTVAPINQQQNGQEKTVSKSVYKDPLFLLIIGTLIITVITLIIAATFMALNLGINDQNFFNPPGTNRVSLNTQQIVNMIRRLH